MDSFVLSVFFFLQLRSNRIWEIAHRNLLSAGDTPFCNLLCRFWYHVCGVGAPAVRKASSTKQAREDARRRILAARPGVEGFSRYQRLGNRRRVD